MDEPIVDGQEQVTPTEGVNAPSENGGTPSETSASPQAGTQESAVSNWRASLPEGWADKLKDVESADDAIKALERGLGYKPAEKADDIVVFEKLQLRDFAQVIAYPVLMAFHKRHRLFARTVLRNRQNGHTVFFINAERQTARPSRMNDFHIKTQIGIDVKGLSTQQCNFHSRLPQIRLLVFFPEEKRRLHARMQHARL